VPIETFVRYGEWFQASLVPVIERQDVATCRRDSDGFQLRLQDGEAVKAGSVVVSSGYRQSARIPEELAGLPPDAVSHSSVHRSFEPFRGKDVIVVGAGQSALESAALLKETGASPVLLARRHHLEWNPRPVLRRSPYQALRYPRTGLGVGLRYAFYEHPFLPFYYLPQAMRHEHVDRVLGPAGAWWLRERIVDQVPSLLGCRLQGVSPRSDRPSLLVAREGRTEVLRADHVIAATGYRVGPESFPFLSPDLRSAVRWDRGSPVLSRRFESAAPGLYFIGLASARSFGPVMRFVDGAQVTAPHLARHLARHCRRSRTGHS
jgi:cation diffusion facilitator CzcD-associated flavoprotein CzcO